MSNKTPYQAHADLTNSVRTHVPPEDQSHTFAMLAKESVFKAQDSIAHAPEHMQRMLDKKLAKLRSELEAFDRACLAAKHKVGR